MIFPKKSVEIIGVPLDLGANRRGAALSPQALRLVGLAQKLAECGVDVHDHGDVPVDGLGHAEPDRRAVLDAIEKCCRTLSQRVRESLLAKRIPLVVGGDHSIAIGSVSGSAMWAREHKQKIGLIWIDAHADINTPESSLTGNVHGMPVATLLGRGYRAYTDIGFPGPKVDSRNAVLVGIRCLDDAEKELCKATGIRYFTMRDIDTRGMGSVMEEAIAMASEGTHGIHVSFDMDGLDPRDSPGVNTPVEGGLSAREGLLALSMISSTGDLLALDMVELNPMTDKKGKSFDLALELVQAALGRAIV